MITLRRAPELLVALCCCVLPSVVVGSNSCSWVDPQSGAVYDLSSLTKPATDAYIFPGGDSVYVANVCGIVEQPCPRSPTNKDATGVQLADGHCLAKIGGLVPPAWAAIDSNDPHKGVRITYGQGDFCATINGPRSMEIEVLCDPTATGVPLNLQGTEGTRMDGKVCSYTLTMHSAAGCPNHSMSLGWTIIICGLVFVAVYCTCGICWNVRFEHLARSGV